MARQGGPFEIFIHSVANHQKIEEGTFGDKKMKKSHNAEKTESGDSLVTSSSVCYAKKGATLIVQFPGTKCTLWRLPKFCRTFGYQSIELFWSLQVYQKTLMKSHDYSRLVS